MEWQLLLEDKIQRYRAIHYLISKLDWGEALNSNTKVMDLVKRYVENNEDLKQFRLKLALACDTDLISHKMLREIAREYGIRQAYKLTKNELLDKLKGIK